MCGVARLTGQFALVSGMWGSSVRSERNSQHWAWHERSPERVACFSIVISNIRKKATYIASSERRGFDKNPSQKQAENMEVITVFTTVAIYQT